MVDAPIEIIPVCDFRVRGQNGKTHTNNTMRAFVGVLGYTLWTNDEQHKYSRRRLKKKIFKPIISHGVEFMSILKGHK